MTDALSVTCPTCNAKPGEPCSRLHRLDGVHISRHDKASPPLPCVCCTMGILVCRSSYACKDRLGRY